MDQKGQDQIWKNPQSNQQNLKPEENQNSLQSPSKLPTVKPQFYWEESLPKKEIPQASDILEAPPKMGELSSHTIAGTQDRSQPQKEENLTARILPHNFMALKPVVKPEFHSKYIPQEDLTAGGTKSKKGLFILIFLLVLSIAFGGGFFFWQKNKTEPQDLVKIVLPARDKSISRVISGYGKNEPSLIKVEGEFTLEEFVDPAKVFIILKPKDWFFEQKDQKISFSQKTPDKDTLGFQYIPRIEIVGQKSTDFLADLEKVKADLAKNTKNQIISEIDRSEKDKNFFAHNIEAVVYDGESAIHVSKLAVSFKENFYLISASSLADNWDHYRNLFNQVLTSFSPAKEI